MKRLWSAWGMGAVVFVYAELASATTINVNTTNCSLDQAVQAVNNRATVGGCAAGNGSSDKIVIPAGTFNVATTSPIVVKRTVQIVGAGQSATILQCSRDEGEDASGDHLFTIVADGALASGQTVAISNLTLKGGGTTGRVGGLANFGLSGPVMTLTASNVRVTAFKISGVYGGSGATNIIGSLINANSVPLDNQSPGGIENHATMNVTGTTIDSNDGINGGGVANYGSGYITIYGSTISNNSTEGDGGAGLYNEGTAIIGHSTISGNFADGAGGGIATASGSFLYLGFCTVANNNGGPGGGVYIDPSAGVQFTDTIVANNIDSSDGSAPDVSGNLQTSTFDLIRSPSGVSGGSNIIYGIDPLLGPLTTVDSTPATHALLPGSPAIDSGIPESTYFQFNLDERGFPRPTDGNGDNVTAYDMGAFEFDPWQTERLVVSAKSSDSHTIVSDPSYSNGQGTYLQSNAINDFVTYRAPLPAAGTYTVKVRVRRGNNRGKFQVQTASNLNGTYTNLGAAQDAYKSSADFVTVTLGNFTVASAGTKYFKFLITGKNASSSGYQLTLDYLQFIRN